MQYFQIIKKSVVSIGFSMIQSISSAGSYEDFFKAVQMDDAKTVQALLQRGFDPNTVNPAGLHGLMIAVREPSLKVAQLLAAWPKVKTEVRNDKDESVLMLASIKGYLPLVKQLVDHDADVNKPGWTPLHYAASTGQVAVIEFLLDHSAYIDAESPNGTTPLMMAAMYGTPEAVKVLIQAGADLSIKNQVGMTALDFAVRGNRQNAKELIETGLQRQAARAARAAQPSASATDSIAVVSTPASKTTQPAVSAPVWVPPVLPPSSAASEPAGKTLKTAW